MMANLPSNLRSTRQLLYTDEYCVFDKHLYYLTRFVLSWKIRLYHHPYVDWYCSDYLYTNVKYIFTVEFDEVSVKWLQEYKYSIVDVRKQTLEYAYFTLRFWSDWFLHFGRQGSVLRTIQEEVDMERVFKFASNDDTLTVMGVVRKVADEMGVLMSPRFVTLARLARKCVGRESN